MFAVVSFFLVFAIFQGAKSEIPENCRKLPLGVNPEKCCDIPPMFKEEDMEECGLDPGSLKVFDRNEDCSKLICLLKKNNLMKDEDSVDKSAIADFMDTWVETNTEYKDVIKNTKDRCLQWDLPGFPGMCEPKKIGMCVVVTRIDECPNWKDNDNCKKMRDHFNECKSYFPF